MKKLLMVTLFASLMLAGCNAGETAPDNGNDSEPNEEAQDNNQNEGSENDQAAGDDEGTNEEDSQNNDQASDDFDKGRAKAELTEYEEAFKMVISNSNEEQKLNEYTTKQGLKDHFKHFMTEEMAQSWVDTYFEKKEDGLYVVSMDGPIFLQEDQPFTFTKTGDQAIVLQERNNELIGHVNMKYTLTQRDGYWIVQDVAQVEPSK